jgi:hypothetical protein
MPDAKTPPVVSTADVLAVLPAFVRLSDSADVRDAIVAGLTAILLRYQALSGYSASQCDIATAEGIYLDGLCEDRDVYRQAGEADDPLRARALTTPDLVTPTAILAAANTILAKYTPIQAEYAESVLDRWYVQDGTARWHSFIGANPQYLRRLYADDAAANGGAVRPNARIGGAWTFGDRLGRYFILRVPVLTGLADAHAFVLRGPGGTFMGDGKNAGGLEAKGSLGLFVYQNPSTALTVYGAIASAINRIKGHSIRWQLIADSRLT